MTAAENRTEPYTDQEWAEAVTAVNDAERELLDLRSEIQKLQARYGTALENRLQAQEHRDHMIVTDPRTPAEIGRRAGLGRSRCSQIRTAAARNATRAIEGVIL